MRSLSFRSSAVATFVLVGVGLTARPAAAQVAGTTQSPLPNVLLLVDTSGSMERMTDGSLPEDSVTTKCVPGQETAPNKWGMLVQALTGNMQPFYSCDQLSRASTGTPADTRFSKEFKLGASLPYDVDYALAYHRPLSGGVTEQCVMAPWNLPGGTAGSGGVGPSGNAHGGINATDFPDDALASVKLSYLRAQLDGNSSIATTLSQTQTCLFDQASDGQLDAARDYVRFALMTFDNDIKAQSGVTGSLVGTNQVDFGGAGAPFAGAWSYIRHVGNPFYGNAVCDNVDVGAWGSPNTPGCIPSSFEVGARNEGAPPWEGRLVKFPSPYASLLDLERSNDQLQRVLLASRPYGATPIDGMMDDARDYYLSYRGGPGAPSSEPSSDPYSCRQRYIIILTDGAPNLDLRPSCTGSGGASVTCPYPKTAAEIASQLVLSPSASKVTTFVIGFAVSGEGSSGSGFPSGATQNCRGWYEDAAGGNGSPTQMKTVCTASNPAAGTTAAACCKLNDIALSGSNDGVTPPVGAFFAESQADIVFAFGRIMANIVRTATTRTVPAYTPTAQYTDTSLASVNQNTSAQFVASFIPSSQRPWSGELDRTRYQCSAMATPPSQAQPETTTAGDLMSVNLAQQATDGNRLVLSVLAKKIGNAVDSAGTIRPYANASSPASFTGGDGLGAPDGALVYPGKEVAMVNALTETTLQVDADWPLALNIDDTTCKKSRAVATGTEATRGTAIIPALNAQQCTNVSWGFATAYPSPLSYAGYNKFNIRCNGTSSTAGKCSISGTTCTVGAASCSAAEVCIPQCSALGAIYHSNPLVVGPPNDFLREEGFRTFQETRRKRQPITYVASIDGLLHAFKSLETGGPSAMHELWAFAPPAVLPRLNSNYPQGNQVILDGSPVVSEAIWERSLANTIGTSAAAQWHTTLVAGLGQNGGGYYALNVTDADCSNGGAPSTSACISGANKYELPSPSAVLADVANSGVISTATKRGPHFLWQLTDVVGETTGETAKLERNSPILTTGQPTPMRALFGKNTGTPAIGMVQIANGTDERQVGIAILPGGYENSPTPGGVCPRGAAPRIADITNVTATRNSVRQWASNCGDPVPGRGVTIVRLDTGEVIRHFGRLNDVPLHVRSRTIATDFDAPVTGTPVVYPSGPGVPIQKIFVGDADGTLWRIDVSNTNPSLWRVALFQDLASTQAPSGGQPIQVSPVLSTNATGNLVINVATGDQDSIVVNNAERDFVYSITEVRSATTGQAQAQVNWYLGLPAAERVTGPMVVFDRSLYFASYQPLPPAGATCGDPGLASLWGLDFENVGTGGVAGGGAARWCPLGNVDPVTGLCTAAYVNRETRDAALIPGVSLRTSSACAVVQTVATDEIGTGAYSQISPVQYSLNFGLAKAGTSPGMASTPQADRFSTPRQLPRNSTKIDSWSIVIE